MAPIHTPVYRCSRCRNTLKLQREQQQRMRQTQRSSGFCETCNETILIACVMHCCQSCGATIESPTELIDEICSCPACGESHSVPAPLLLRANDPTLDAHTHFMIRCDNCDEEQAVSRGDVNKVTACLFCYSTVRVPMAGEQIAQRAEPHSGAPSRFTIVHHDCPSCGQRIPKKLAICPLCGA